MAKMSPAELSRQLYSDYNSCSGRQEWATQNALNLDYYLNKQWTNEETGVLEARGQAALVVNRVFPVVQQKLAQLSAHKPVLRAIGVEGGDADKAELWTMMVEYVLQNSNFGLIDIEVKREHIVGSVGYYYAYVDPYDDDGKGEVKVASLSPDIVYVDPNSRKVDFSDAAHVLVSRLYSMSQAYNLYPSKKRTLNAAKNQLLEFEDHVGTVMASGEAVVTPAALEFRSTIPGEDDKVRIIERYSKVQVPFYIVISQSLGFYNVVDAETYRDVFAGNDEYEVTQIWKTQIERVITAGYKGLLHKEVLPISDYPIVPVPNIWVGTPFPLSDVHYIRSLQDEINKRRSLLILNATGMSSPKYLAEEGSIDKRKWDEDAHIPGAVLTYRAGFPKPEVVYPQPLPSALVQLEAEAKHDVEYTSGVFAISQGDPQGAPETFSATLALEEYANRRMANTAEILSHAKRILGRVIIGLCQDTYTIPKMIRVVGDEGLVTEVIVNHEGNVLDQAKYDVIIESGRFAPTNRVAHGQFMMDLYERGIIDNQGVLEALDLPKKEKLLERVALTNQQANTIRAQSDEIKNLEGLLQTLRRQLQQAGIKTVVGETRLLEKAELMETKVKQKSAREAIDLDVAATNLELQNIEKRFELDQREEAINAKASQTSSKGAGKKEKE